MGALFASGRAADLILAIMAVELVWLVVSRRMAALEAVGLIVPGMLIVVGLRGALTGAAWPWISAPLALALPVHMLDLRARLRRSSRA